MNKMSLDLHIFYSFLWRLNAVISFVPDFHHFVPSLRLQETVDLYLICLVLHKHNKKWYYKTHIYCRHVLKDTVYDTVQKNVLYLKIQHEENPCFSLRNWYDIFKVFFFCFFFLMKRLKWNPWPCQDLGQYSQIIFTFVLIYFFFHIIIFSYFVRLIYTGLNVTNLYKLPIYVHMETHTQRKRKNRWNKKNEKEGRNGGKKTRKVMKKR